MTIGSFGLLMLLAFVAAYFVLRADIRRRGLKDDAQNIVTICALLGIAGAKLYHVFESPSDLLANPLGEIFSRSGFALIWEMTGKNLCRPVTAKRPTERLSTATTCPAGLNAFRRAESSGAGLTGPSIPSAALTQATDGTHAAT